MSGSTGRIDGRRGCARRALLAGEREAGGFYLRAVAAEVHGGQRSAVASWLQRLRADSAAEGHGVRSLGADALECPAREVAAALRRVSVLPCRLYALFSAAVAA